MSAALRVSFAVIVMLRTLFTVARDVLALLLYMVRSARDGLIVSNDIGSSNILWCYIEYVSNHMQA